MSFQQNLLHWFQENKRDLPWRRHYDPYAVWVSEMMLQQTQMSTALPYYERWMRQFPTIAALAKADAQSVMKAWQGLGYYARARNLHQSAQRIIKEFAGRFPEDFDTIRSLKGIGRYSAGAIASIAFNQKRPLVDGNVFRVLSRTHAISAPIDDAKNKETFWALQESLIPDNARDFNQALMELGALICTAQNPACAVCPIRPFCKAHKTGNPENYPVKLKKKKTVRVTAAALALESNGKYFIHLRPLGGIMGGLWEFPEWKLSKNKPLTLHQIKSALSKHANQDLKFPLPAIKHLGSIKRNYTHHLETLHVFAGCLSGPAKPKSAWRSLWAGRKDFSSLPFSSAHVKIIQLLK